MKKAEPLRGIINGSGCVVAYFAGHDHAGGYAVDGTVHHVTVQGMVEAPRRNAYAIVDVFDQRIRIHGFGKVPSRGLPVQDRATSRPHHRTGPRAFQDGHFPGKHNIRGGGHGRIANAGARRGRT
jgi:hypothetical protein